jgi:hypothetical protein
MLTWKTASVMLNHWPEANGWNMAKLEFILRPSWLQTPFAFITMEATGVNDSISCSLLHVPVPSVVAATQKTYSSLPIPFHTSGSTF